jgi:hypothetical protein
MPEGFLFPYRDHLWLPLRVNPLEATPGGGPSGQIMGRLADGVAVEQARREIELLGQRMAGQLPLTHAQLRPQILPYTTALTEIDSPEARLGILVTQTLAILLLALACANVGILILARAATRSAELAIRTALGASRARVVSQLFIEWLLLAVLAAGRLAAEPAHLVSVARVDIGYFEALEQPILNRRKFNAGDLGEDRSAVIVNAFFKDEIRSDSDCAIGSQGRNRALLAWSTYLVAPLAELRLCSQLPVSMRSWPSLSPNARGKSGFGRRSARSHRASSPRSRSEHFAS